MCNQNIISNKFDLILTTMLSSYWCTAIFYEFPLPALRFEKVEETDTKWTTPKRTMPSKSTTSEKHKETSETTDDAQQRKADSLARNDTQRNSKCFQNNADKNVNKHFQEKRQTGSRRNRRRQQKDPFIRELKA